MAIMALSSAVTPFVGQNFGGQQYKRVKQGVRWCYRFSLIYGLTVTVILAMISGYIAEFFTDDPQAIATAQLHLTIVPISYLGLGMAMTANSAFNAIGKPMPAMFVSLIRTILVYAPLAFLLAKLFGLTGIFAAACTANLVAGGLGRIWFRFTYVQTVTEDKAVLKT
jgi:Na+-driven multidrug efflux pump